MHEDVDRSGVTYATAGGTGVVVAAVHGDVDTDSCRLVRRALLNLLDRRCTGLVVDLDRVRFFGSLGIAVLLEVLQQAENTGTGFAVAAGRRAVVRPMRLTDTVGLLRVHRTVEEAVEAARPATGS